MAMKNRGWGGCHPAPSRRMGTMARSWLVLGALLRPGRRQDGQLGAMPGTRRHRIDAQQLAHGEVHLSWHWQTHHAGQARVGVLVHGVFRIKSRIAQAFHCAFKFLSPESNRSGALARPRQRCATAPSDACQRRRRTAQPSRCRSSRSAACRRKCAG